MLVDSDRTTALAHLQVLNENMSEVSAEANGFGARFLFGGMVAVMALINAGLVVESQITAAAASPRDTGLVVLAVVVLSGIYFYFVAERLRHLRRAYRATKHKYEVNPLRPTTQS